MSSWGQAIDKALSNFPFSDSSDEELLKSDIIKFFFNLYSCSEHVYYSPEGDVCFRSGTSKQLLESECTEIREYMQEWMMKFHCSSPSGGFIPDKIKNKLPKPIQKKFYKTLKYYYTCNMFNMWLLEENRFYSLPLLLESWSDIDASFLLSSNFLQTFTK